MLAIELLTGRAPHAGKDPKKVMRMIQEKGAPFILVALKVRHQDFFFFFFFLRV